MALSGSFPVGLQIICQEKLREKERKFCGQNGDCGCGLKVNVTMSASVRVQVQVGAGRTVQAWSVD
jgi:hypothetical protein